MFFLRIGAILRQRFYAAGRPAWYVRFPKNIKANFGGKSIYPLVPRLPLLPRNAPLARLPARTLARVPCNRLERIGVATMAVLRTHPLPLAFPITPSVAYYAVLYMVIAGNGYKWVI